jgi:hypothetical protein
MSWSKRILSGVGRGVGSGVGRGVGSGVGEGVAEEVLVVGLGVGAGVSDVGPGVGDGVSKIKSNDFLKNSDMSVQSKNAHSVWHVRGSISSANTSRITPQSTV